jgi:hypothetical protein
MRSFFIIVVFILIGFASSAQATDKCCHVEIYLLNGTYTFRPDNFSPIGYFMPQRGYLADTPLVRDDEILSYEIPRDSSQPYYMNLKAPAAKKLDSLSKKAPLFDGLPFAVVVDGTPIYGGYLWNLSSSFGCDWILGWSWPDRIGFYPGLPHYCFSPAHPDPRGDSMLMDRFRRTGRLVFH